MNAETPETNSHLGSLANAPDNNAMWLEIGLPRKLERERNDANARLSSIHEKAKSALQTSWLYSGKDRVEMLMREISNISLPTETN